MNRSITVFLFLIFANLTSAQIDRVEPPNWWIGFKNSKLQLLVKGENIASAIPSIEYEGVSINKITSGDSSNYIFIDLNIDRNTNAGTFEIVFKPKKGRRIKYNYQLKSRVKSAEDYIGFNSTDVIYLITPDRFANGDPSNDINKKMNENTIDRTDDYGRHGGDIRGIINHLDYIENMGFTAIWPSPLLTNDMFQASYHGYAMTNFYEVDPRFGTIDEYIELATKARQKGIKLIMDQVANHCGLEHWWMKDLPFNDWINFQKKFESKDKMVFSNHRRTANMDTYASAIDKKELSEGWFVNTMPDLNQNNPFMASYITQNSIWWIETLGLGGIRQDTYPYPDKNFMSSWAGAIMKEYPNFNIVGEEWSYNPLLINYWQQGANNKDGYQSNLRSTMDFAMQNLVIEALKEDDSWNKGLIKLYEGLANDFIYTSPKDIMVFPDNHDMDRIFTRLNKDVVNTKMALATYLLMPRTPQIYYGTEILMENTAKPGDHGLIRSDFPGGWTGDSTNAITGEGLTEDQKEMQSYLKKLLNYRKTSTAIHDGKTVHFGPVNGIYVIARILKDETVLLLLNKNQDEINLDLDRFKELGLSGKKMTNIISNEVITWKQNLKLPGKGAFIFSSK
ncbi:glycoside hydrolase family 13 protein [Spongiivirga citrea]|uniref:Alpha-amylase n=1 Tax=Spongiivirga citrea TaxID=1481457 RepID=A0A6M0CIV9_9FLAO|nr:glycoside hydrolase family 13 protein [Spongiivirga citrea]NER16913.1 alpha-amylase [Spongiivirga citrea]